MASDVTHRSAEPQAEQPWWRGWWCRISGPYGTRQMPASFVLTAHVLCLPGTVMPTLLLLKFFPDTVCNRICVRVSVQDVADIRQQFPSLGGDIKFPAFFREEQFFSSVFRISSPGLQLWTHYDVRRLQNKEWEGSDVCCSRGSDIHRSSFTGPVRDLSIAAGGTWS